MDGRDLSQLFAICGACHELATFTVTGARRTPEERHEMAAALNGPKPKRAKRKKGKGCGRGPMTLAEIRASSLEYAEGRRP